MQSVDFHESGKKHKENVAAKISEVNLKLYRCVRLSSNQLVPHYILFSFNFIQIKSKLSSQITHNQKLVMKGGGGTGSKELVRKIKFRGCNITVQLLLAESCCQLYFWSCQIKKKSMDKAKQEERMSKEFAAMEEAAERAYQEDLKRMGREAAGPFNLNLIKIEQ